LALNPEIQSKLFQEVNQLLEKETPFNEIVDRMPYLNSCLKESLRLMPAGLRIERKAVENSFLENIYVPKNCLVNIPIYFVHRDPDNFENPND
jgi:cytochrome P450